jgi:multicomponent Na+:H+ antiporter subunit B
VTRTGRLGVFALSAVGLALLLGWGLAGLPDFGHYPGPLGDIATQLLPPERRVANVPTGIVFDLRGFDTLGEELILFAATTGVALLLRETRSDASIPSEESTEDDELRLLGLALIPPTVLLGLYLALFGHITPGGGFQGGIVLATAFVLLYVAGGSKTLDRLAPSTLADGAEGTGLAAYVLIGLIGLVAAGEYLHNFLPYGSRNMILSAGTVPLLNLTVALAVVGALVLLVRDLLQELLLERRSEE